MRGEREAAVLVPAAAVVLDEQARLVHVLL
jgi:hypothetical protein